MQSTTGLAARALAAALDGDPDASVHISAAKITSFGVAISTASQRAVAMCILDNGEDLTLMASVSRPATWMGAHNASESYLRDEVVEYEGQKFIALRDSPKPPQPSRPSLDWAIWIPHPAWEQMLADMTAQQQEAAR
jgi:hypothetical protein